MLPSACLSSSRGSGGFNQPTSTADTPAPRHDPRAVLTAAARPTLFCTAALFQPSTEQDPWVTTVQTISSLLMLTILLLLLVTVYVG